MIEKVWGDFDAAVADVPDGATIMFSGFGQPGVPTNLILALQRRGTRDITAISNRAGGGRGISDDDVNLGTLIKAGQVRKVVCTITAPAKRSMEVEFDRLYQAGKIEAELVPQGTLAERIRAAAAGIGGFYVRTGVGTEIAEGKETRSIDGNEHVFERPLRADFALLRAWRADRWGNLKFRLAQRNFGPLMAMAAPVTIVEVENKIQETGSLDPDQIHLPGNYVQRMVFIPPHPDGHWTPVVRQT